MRHYEKSIFISTDPETLFAYANDHSRFSSHMSQSSWMMGGGKMDMQMDNGRGRAVGSHIRLKGYAFGIKLFLDEVITQYDPPRRKAWQTVGSLKLLVIGHYLMGMDIAAQNKGSTIKVFIDYELPEALSSRWIGYLFGGIYAKWCVGQMLRDIQKHFNHSS